MGATALFCIRTHAQFWEMNITSHWWLTSITNRNELYVNPHSAVTPGDSPISPVFGALSSLLHRVLAQFHNFSIVHRCMHFLAHCPTLTKAHQHCLPLSLQVWVKHKAASTFLFVFFFFSFFCTGFLKVVTNTLHNVCSASSLVLLFHCTPPHPITQIYRSTFS